MKYIKVSNVLIINDKLLPTHLEPERDSIRPDFNLNTNHSSRHRHDKSRTEKKMSASQRMSRTNVTLLSGHDGRTRLTRAGQIVCL